VNPFSSPLLVAALLSASVAAQVASYVAVIKENPAPGSEGRSALQPGGGFVAEHVSVRGLIRTAHGVKPFEVVGAPAWFGEAFFDIRAHTASASADWADTFAMVRMLLKDRFQLAFHRERRLVDGFAIVRVDLSLSSRAIRPSSVRCGFNPQPAPCSANALHPGFLHSVGWSLDAVAEMLKGEANVPLIDDTKMPGLFDLELRWPSDLLARGDVSALSAALQQQLGLKLEARKVSIEAFVVDRLERPRPD
jgi:uncharacterized protein (TIGR03435 family)